MQACGFCKKEVKIDDFIKPSKKKLLVVDEYSSNVSIYKYHRTYHRLLMFSCPHCNSIISITTIFSKYP